MFDAATADGPRIKVVAAGGIGDRIAGNIARSTREVECLISDTPMEDVAAAMTECDMVFIVSGMEDASIACHAADLAQLAREAGILSVALVPRSAVTRLEALEPLRHLVKAFLLVSRECLIQADGAFPDTQSFSNVEDYLVWLAVDSLVTLITQHGPICIDFADVRAILSEGGPDACLGIGIDQSAVGAREAAMKALCSLQVQDLDPSRSAAMLAMVTSSTNMTMEDFDSASGVLHKALHGDALVIVGVLMDDALGRNFRVLSLAKRQEVRRGLAQKQRHSQQIEMFLADDSELA